jgi:hypothetical protein
MTSRIRESLHEDLTREDVVAGASERSFGLTFAALFALIAIIKLWHGTHSGLYWLAAAAAMLALALLWTAPLRPLNRAWFRLSLVLHAVATPVMMAAMFYLAVLPTGLLIRLFRKDPLSLRGQPARASYWIDRADDGTDRDRMRTQF